MDDLLRNLAVALAIGLLIGLERGWHGRDEAETKRAAGFRTFALTGLLGGIAAAVAQATAPVVLGFVFLGFIGAFTAFHWLEARVTKDVGMTTEVAGMLTFLLGAYAVLGDRRIAVAGAVAMALLLALREPLHRWVERLSWEEIRAVLILLAMTFLLLPVLPDRTIDPWNTINPADIWLLAIMIAAISFGGYVAVRLFGDRLGIVMAAVAGGLASSTAVTLTFSRMGGQDPASDRLLSGGILVAGTVMVARVAIVVALLNRALLVPLLPALAAMAVVMAASAALLLLRRSDGVKPKVEITNPLELGTAVKLALLIAVVMAAAEIVRDLIGDAGVLIVAAASGIADVDAVTISMSRLGGQQLALETAARAVALAVGVNTVSKAVMAASVGGRRIGLYVGAASVLGIAAAAAVLLMVRLPFAWPAA